MYESAGGPGEKDILLIRGARWILELLSSDNQPQLIKRMRLSNYRIADLSRTVVHSISELVAEHADTD
jgi:hypothetical protein